MAGNIVPITASTETLGTPTKPFGLIHADNVRYQKHAYFDAVQTATGDGTTTIVWTSGNMMKFTFGAQNETFTFTAPDGPTTLKLWLIQDGVGSRTATWPGTVEWGSNGTAPTLSTGVADKDFIIFVWDGTSYTGGTGSLDIA